MRLFAASVQQPFAVFACLLLAACGGGGGGGGGTPGTGFSLSTNALNFVAETPSTAPPSLPLTGTVSGSLSGTLYIKLVAGGGVISFISAPSFNSAASGTVSVFPANPGTLGVGSHSGTITVTACLNDPNCATGQLPGSPQIVTVSYLVKSSVHAETVMPHVATANQSGKVVIRGTGFVGNNVNKVAFGITDAVAFTVVGDTEIRATYPVLAASTYNVNLANASGAVPFSGKLAVVTPKTYAAGTLAYPSTPQQTLAVKYDAEREAVLIAASYYDGFNFNTASRVGNQILRYQFANGVFGALTTKVIPLLQDLAPDGAELIAVTDTELIHLDPVTLAEIRRSTATPGFLPVYFKEVVVTNDGNALLTTGLNGSGDTTTYLYPLSQSQFLATNHSCNYFASPGVSADGSLAVFIQGGVSPTPPLCSYDASSGAFAVLPITANQFQCTGSGMGTCRRPSLDASGSRIAVIDSSFTVSIYDRTSTLLGLLPGTAGAVAFSPDSARAYTFDSSGSLRTFDLTLPSVSGKFQEIGMGTALAGSPGPDTAMFTPSAVVRLTTSPDGRTLFFAGGNQLVIQPAP